MKKTVLREYARLIVRSGVNVRKGQEVLIYADLDQPEFGHLLQKRHEGVREDAGGGVLQVQGQ